MKSGNWVMAACILFFCLCAAGAWLDDQQGAAYLFMVFVAGSLALVGFARYKRKTTATTGPVDPSYDWPSSNDARACETGTFRYSQGTLTFLRATAWISTLVAPVIYLVSSPRPSGTDLVVLVLIGTAIFAVIYLVFLACRSYSIDVQADGVVVTKLTGARTYKFSMLGMVALLDCGGGRGPRYVLAVYDKANRMLWKIDDGFDGFQKYVTLMKKRCFEQGVTYRYRDMWGSWTR